MRIRPSTSERGGGGYSGENSKKQGVVGKFHDE